jgi:CubicO group peptidase (beta-lactamase class C family)
MKQRMFGAATAFGASPRDRKPEHYQFAPTGLTPTDAAATSAFLEPPRLIAGGGGLVSTVRDYARFGAMLLGDGALDGTRVMKVETARAARPNLLRTACSRRRPVRVPACRSCGPATKPSCRQVRSLGSGATGCLWWMDPTRHGNVVFLTQVIGIGQAAYTVPAELSAALEAGLKEPA